MIISQVIGYPFFGIGSDISSSIKDAIAKCYDEDPLQVTLGETMPISYDQIFYRVTATLDSRSDPVIILINTKEYVYEPD